MTDTSRLRALVEQWRQRAAAQRELVARGESLNPLAMSGMADANEERADELEAAIRAEEEPQPLGSSVTDWKSAALCLGESLAANGPNGYYAFTPDQWLTWARERAAEAPPSASDDDTTSENDPGAYPVPPSVSDNAAPGWMQARAVRQQSSVAAPAPPPVAASGWQPPTFEKSLEALLNAHSQENTSNTPDFILAQYLLGCLAAWNTATQQRETWYGRDARPTAGTGAAPAPPPEPQG